MKLTAYRAEPHRFERLAKVYAGVSARAASGPNGSDWSGAMRGMDDAKGDLTVYWRDQTALDRFSDLVDELWVQHDPHPDVVHIVGENSRDLDRMPVAAIAEPAGPAPHPSQSRIYAVFAVGFMLGALAAIALL